MNTIAAVLRCNFTLRIRYANYKIHLMAFYLIINIETKICYRKLY